MTQTDPIADMLTRIRNALTVKKESVDVPASKIKAAIAEILVEEGYVKSAEVVRPEGAVQDVIHIELKYTQNKEKVINGLKKISKPGLRVYAKADALIEKLHLTEPEIETVNCYMSGMKQSEAAATLGITIFGVKYRKLRIRQKYALYAGV